MATIKGKWRWNDVIDFNLIAHYMNDYYYAYFTSNGEDFEEISMGIDLGGSVWIAYKRDGVAIYLSPQQNPGEMSTYVDEAYRTMDFGGTEQEIEDEFYEILTLVAEPYFTIADKLLMVAENEPKVYEAGKAEGRTEGYEEGYNKGYNEGFDTDAFEAGKRAEHDTFWDAFQGATRRIWSNAFQDASWNDGTFYPKYDLVISGNASALFRYCGITDLEGRLIECGVTLDTSECTSLNTAFGECKLITAIPPIDVSKCTASSATNGMFSGCISLKTVRKFIVSEETQFSNTFQNCPLLENIVFEGVIGNDIDLKSSTKLTRASIESIINHLSDTVSGKTLTLSKRAVDDAFEFRAEINGEDYVSKGTDADNPYWWSLIATKPNWAITLV